MNTPGCCFGSWRWRMTDLSEVQSVLLELAELTSVCGRGQTLLSPQVAG